MPYRDDREADVARADALQVEVERSERELAAARKKLAETERSRDALAAELARRAPAETHAPEPPPAPPPSGNLVATFLVVACAVGGFGWCLSTRVHEQHEAAARELDSARQLLNTQITAEPCTLHTVPEGASVYGNIGGEEVRLGETPMVMSMPPIATSPSIVVRADGYAQHELSLWDGCPPTLHLAR